MAALKVPTFWLKVPLAAGLVFAADRMIFGADAAGLNLGAITLAVALAALAAHPAIRRNRLGITALAAAGGLALLQVEHASLVAWLLFWTALGVAVLSARANAGDGAWQWAQRLFILGVGSLIRPPRDALKVLKTRQRRRGARWQALLLTLALPAIGGVVFFLLFANANPIIGDWVASLRLPALDFDHVPLLGAAALLSWGALRPTFLRRTWTTPDAQGELVLPGVSTASITLSLAVFNAVFALQNGLDIAFLWSGAPLPEGMTLAEYAHRGAYPLIATALLAGIFVIVFLRPGTATANSPLVRRLVILWIVQNVFLVASTALRTLDYIDVYSLTRLRIAALLWMGLVATGLGLIGWRLIKAKSTAWLINANVLAAGVVLTGCAVADLGAIAAGWNLRRAREMGGRGAPLDVDYLVSLGDAGLVSMAQLEQKPLSREMLCDLQAHRTIAQAQLEERQADWRSWTWRGARRLQTVRDLAGNRPPLACAPQKVVPAPVAAPALTPAPNPGT